MTSGSITSGSVQSSRPRGSADQPIPATSVPAEPVGSPAPDAASPDAPPPVTADLRSAFIHAPIGMAVLTPDAIVSECNAALSRFLGRSIPELVGGDLFRFTHPEDLAQAKEACDSLSQDDVHEVSHRCRFERPDGSAAWALVSTSRVRDDEEHLHHAVMHVQDITDTVALEAELLHRVHHDPLTGVANRSLLLERAAAALGGTSGSPVGEVSLVFMDLNGFKRVNDTLGHSAGDAVLVALARRLRGAVRESDTVARLGGDEFAVLSVGADPAATELLAQRLVDAVAEPFQIGEDTVELSAAAGFAVAGTVEDAPDAEELLQRADLSMYQRKRAG